ncbi:hypothetical protein BaRGS_00020645 [Batillaria attramentaria]|uniref:DDE Tnp4 domain-containing protein n=1 Tax=Batillaria attramentaria TaxID=370345 RepID=A0ABD0KLL0_9CAEN
MNNLHDPAEEEERRRQRIFDYRLSRARRISENVFGILASRFRVFQTSMLLSPENATRVTLAALAVHNFLMTKRDQAFAPPSLPDREHPQSDEVIPGQWRDEPNLLDELRRQRVNRSGDAAREVREEIKKYMNEEGQVPWQEGLVFRRTARV